MPTNLVFRTAIAAVLAAQQALAQYDGVCPCNVGTARFDGDTHDDADADCRAQDFSISLQSTAVADAQWLLDNGAAATQAGLDCLDNPACFTTCVHATDAACAASNVAGELATPERAATDSFDSCALLVVDVNWPGNPAAPAKTAQEKCNLFPGCTTSSDSCVKDERDIPMVEAWYTCTGTPTDVTSSSECAQRAGCEWSNGPFVTEECDDDDAAVMACYPVLSTFCSSHRAAIGRMAGSSDPTFGTMLQNCPPPPPPPPATTSGGSDALPTMVAIALGSLIAHFL